MPGEYPEDEALVAALIGGGADFEGAVARLIDLCDVSIKFVCRRYSLDYDEVLGDVFLTLQEDDWRRLKTWRGASSLKTWLRTVIVRQAISMMRSTATREVGGLDQIEAIGSESPDSMILQAEKTSQVLEAVSKLNPTEIYVVTARYFQGKTLKEIGSELNKSENAVKQTLHRARGKLAEILGGEYE